VKTKIPEKQIKVKVLLPALVSTPEQEQMTARCKKSLISLNPEVCLKVQVDGKKYDKAVAAVWNAFLDEWRGKEYDYLLITANDTEADAQGIDHMIRCAESYPNAGMITGMVERDYDSFKKNYGQYTWDSKTLTTERPLDPACFLLRKGVIEKVGRIDEFFPREFVEVDYIRRIRLAGFDVIQPEVVTWYHPSHAGTIGNDNNRLQQALRRYMYKWGGDAYRENFLAPLNDFRLDYTHCIR
jgi:hypothetical protein